MTSVPPGDAWSIVAVDVNEDGAPDLVTATAFQLGAVLIGQGDGTFESGPTLTEGPSKVVRSADLNGDGHQDLISGGDRVAILLGNGDGTFDDPKFYAAGPETGSSDLDILGLQVADLNGDSIPDVLAANWVASQLAVLLGEGDGTFASAVTYSCPHCDAVATADFDGDGNADVVTTGFKPGVEGTMLVYPNDGDGRLGDLLALNPNGHAVAVAVGDINGDGGMDIVTGNANSQSVSVLSGVGDGTFTAAETHPAGNTHSVALVDLNGDGRLDLLAGSREHNKLWFYRGSEDGALVPTTDIPLESDIGPFFAVADLNGDSRLDLALYEAGNSRYVISVWLGQ